jgi:phospholipid transport system substrate-binding protein
MGLGRRVPALFACVLAAVLMLALAPGFARPADAAEPDGAEARRVVQAVADRALALLRRPDKTGREAAFLQMFRDDFATAAIGRFVLGTYRASATPEQFTRYMSVFETLVSKTTAARLRDYAGETLEISTVRAEGERWVVTSRVTPKAREPVRIDWVVAPSKAGLKVVDLRVENLSLAITERDEFAAILQQNNGDIDKLITFMQDKIKKLDAGERGASAPAPPR